jgi:hypothetical protein
VPIEQGTHAFRLVLNRSGLEAIQKPEELDAKNCILIVFGETQILDTDVIPGGLGGFLKKGGAVLIATDRPNQGKWQSIFKIEFKDQFVHAPSRIEYQYKAHVECPFVVDLHVKDIPIFRGYSEVATNKPAYFINIGPTLKTLATFPDGSWAESTRNRLEDLPGVAFAAAGPLGEGRALILSDHSVFINGMMIQSDNDNFDFAFQCIRWLKDGDKRTRVLFLDEGEPITDLKVPEALDDIPMPSVEILNRLLAKIEQEDLFNKLIRGPEGQRMGDILRVLTIVITTAVTGLGCYRFLHARHRHESGEPLFSGKLAQLTPEYTLMTQRHLDMVKADNFWEAAHHLTRDWFHSVNPELMGKEDGSSRSALPQFTIDAGWWARRSWKGKLNKTWQLAAGSPRRLTAAEFARFIIQLDELKAAHNRGILQFHHHN